MAPNQVRQPIKTLVVRETRMWRWFTFTCHVTPLPRRNVVYFSSGAYILGTGTRHVVNRAATALRMAATTLLNSKSYLGAQYRCLHSRLGAPKAITAMAHKLARLVYRMLKFGQQYVDKGTQFYENKYWEQHITLLKKNAAKLGLQILEPLNADPRRG